MTDTHPGASPQPRDTPETTPDPANRQTPEEIKAKFREALAKKHEQPAHDSSSAGPGRSKVHGTQRPAGHKREFRRKSG
ncbi:DUF5302 domain-containing protein [Spelaeicoccus albus]|uniref:DUF5302 domain-containing protein n=1 Tax=Spelaeicoccus albus TaxID=1280376 RepID=A0A7Z0D1Q4_9MICO|nr:DUF5302 domain-containing protein [Spelaeicoccus albus]NYI66627.1 hypothetical protein [Spelaeicoccus albus]